MNNPPYGYMYRDGTKKQLISYTDQVTNTVDENMMFHSFDDKAAYTSMIVSDTLTLLSVKVWCYHGHIHRTTGPARVVEDLFGNVVREIYYLYGVEFIGTVEQFKEAVEISKSNASTFLDIGGVF